MDTLLFSFSLNKGIDLKRSNRSRRRIDSIVIFVFYIKISYEIIFLVDSTYSYKSPTLIYF